MRAEVRGPFRVSDEAGTNRTPKGMRERALLAILLLSPGQRRSRAWLQDKLWSDRSPERASVSFRQALSHIRKALGPLARRLHADRSAVWIEPKVVVDPSPQGNDVVELLDDIDVPDAEFERWLRDLRQQHGIHSHASPAPRRPVALNRPLVIIREQAASSEPTERFTAQWLAQRIAGELTLVGEIDIRMASDTRLVQMDELGDVEIVIEALSADQQTYMLLRTLGRPHDRCVWTGRLHLPSVTSAMWASQEATQIINRAVGSVSDLLALSCGAGPFAAVQRAVRRIHDFDRFGLEAADRLLIGAQDGDLSGLAMAWRGFVRLTLALEFRSVTTGLRDEAVSFCDAAMARAVNHPVVLALSAQVKMKLCGDYDHGLYLARRATEAGDQNPYALNALSHAMAFRGERERGYAIADTARRAADGLSNSFSWDMQCCFSALGLGMIDTALEQALSSHRKMPVYRPALRYLVALYLLSGRCAEAEHFAERLRLLEPDFALRLLVEPDYPVETLRSLGLVEGLRPMLD